MGSSASGRQRWLVSAWLVLPVLAMAGVCPAAPITLGVDIRPGICPNHLNVESPLVIPVAILGTVDFEVAWVDPGSIRISREGVAAEVEPVGWAYKDVGSPLIGGRCSCHELRGDGLDDLELYFSIRDLTAGLDLRRQVGRTVPLTLSGKLQTGEEVMGSDCAVVINGAWANDGVGEDVCMLECTTEGSVAEPFTFAYYTTVSDHVTLAIYDVRGAVVATLIDMEVAPGIYHTSWNGTGSDSHGVPAGVYFARVNNSRIGDTRKIKVLQ